MPRHGMSSHAPADGERKHLRGAQSLCLTAPCEAKFQPMPLYLAAIFLLGVVDDGSDLQQISGLADYTSPAVGGHPKWCRAAA